MPLGSRPPLTRERTFYRSDVPPLPPQLPGELLLGGIWQGCRPDSAEANTGLGHYICVTFYPVDKSNRRAKQGGSAPLTCPFADLPTPKTSISSPYLARLYALTLLGVYF